MALEVFSHDWALVALAVAQGAVSLPAHNWALSRLARKASAWSTGKFQARYVIAAVVAILVLALVFILPLYVFGLVPLQGRAPTFIYSWFAGLAAWWGITHVINWHRALMRKSERRA